MKCRKGFQFIDSEKVGTPVYDARSLFVPDLSMNVRDIITRFSITGDVSALQNAVDKGFDGNDEFDEDGYSDLSSMDIAELQELSEKARQILDDYARSRNDVAKPQAPAVDSAER